MEIKQSIDVDNWLKNSVLEQPQSDIVHKAYLLSQINKDHVTCYNIPCLAFSLEIAHIVARLKLGQKAVAASLAYSSMVYGKVNIKAITEQLDQEVIKLVHDICKMDGLVHIKSDHDHKQINKLRRLLLAIVNDIRVIVIKLAERLAIMRFTKKCSATIKQTLAKETMKIYAPLANRLGIYQLKWELEDIAFYYLYPNIYKHITKALQQGRKEREKSINKLIATIKLSLQKIGLDAKVCGRAKHIYSIYSKMQRKNVDFSQIYDAHAIRILVPEIKDCYSALSVVHDLWPAITKEFDDYIRIPKTNGYQSIHTAVIGPHHHNFEIQIRTYQMDQAAKQGIAAHWIYKEGGRPHDEQKVAWLRALLKWQQEVRDDYSLQQLQKKIFKDYVYVFTPQSDIIDLPQGATPLDFAYSIHTEVGHRCRGAKINGKMLPLSYALHTGDKVEIITANQSQPSRDWLMPKYAYLKTTRARVKVAHFFKQQDYNNHVDNGKTILTHALQHLHLPSINLEKTAHQFNFKTPNDMLAALGNGKLKINTIIQSIEPNTTKPKRTHEKTALLASSKLPLLLNKNDINIHGISNMVTHIAKCCNPIPGDAIIGYITQGQGISIHHHQCKNICSNDHHSHRMIEVHWQNNNQQSYQAAIIIDAHNREGLINDITHNLANNKVSVLRLYSSLSKSSHTAHIDLTIEVKNIKALDLIIANLKRLPSIYQVKRNQ